MRGAVRRVVSPGELSGVEEGIWVALAKVSFDACFQCARLFFVGADDEDGVVSGDAADDFGPVFVVDPGGNGLGASGGGDEDEEVECLADFEAEAFEDFTDAGERIFV